MAAASSTSFFGTRDEDLNQMMKQQQQLSSSMPMTTAPQTVGPVKKKRNLPGTPNPDAEVIAFSPKTLMATNRFACEVCGKGFQREQNLQLHRRGHNLPWKLRQRSTKEARRKVYLCPEPACIHHDPSRALGDLTGIKKHYSRKHGEKKWKCDKCSKKYAVRSDWKAHSKTCGTREYRCDCGTLFSRRDSFITHRAFCDALAQEGARLPPSRTTLGSHLSCNTSAVNLTLSHQVSTQVLSSLQDQTHPSADLLRLGGSTAHRFNHLLPHPSCCSSSSPFQFAPNQDFSITDHDTMLHQTRPFHGMLQLPELNPNNNANLSSSLPLAASAGLFNQCFFSNNGNAGGNQINAHHLPMCEQFDYTESSNNNEQSSTLFAGNLMNNIRHHVTNIYNNGQSVLAQLSATALLQKATQMGVTTSSGDSLLLRSQMDRNESSLLDELMNSLANGSGTIFGGYSTFGADSSGINCDGLTRDFLGVGSMMRGRGGGTSQREKHHLSLDSESKFGGGSTQ